MTNFEMAAQVEKYASYPASFVEPFSGKLYDRSYGAMPANPFRDDEIKRRQSVIENELRKLFEYPPENLEVPESFRTFLLDDYEIGERRRQMTSYENYMKWQLTSPKVSALVQPQLDRYEAGYAEVDDVIDIALHTDANGLEAGRLTHGYWRRMEFLPALRRDVAQSIEKHGGRLELRVAPYRSIDIEPHVTRDEKGAQTIDGILARYKHDIGSIVRPDGKVVHIVERQIAGIRVDEASGFRQDIIERMNIIAKCEPDFRWDAYKDEQFEYNLRGTGCRGFIEKAIQTDSAADYVVPESTTVYLFTEDPTTSRSMGSAAFRAPDVDVGIAYYDAHMRDTHEAA